VARSKTNNFVFDLRLALITFASIVPRGRISKEVISEMAPAERPQ
jgi:hypothetical protein